MYRREARGPVAALHLDRGRDPLEHPPDRLVGLACERLADERQRRLVGAVFQRLGGLEPRPAVRGHELEDPERRIDLAPQPVVDHDVLAILRQRRDLLAGDGVHAFVTGDDQHALAGRLHGSVGERLQQRLRPFVARRNERVHRRDLLVALAEGKLADRSGVERGRRTRGKAQRKQQPQQESAHTSVPKWRRRLRAAAILRYYFRSFGGDVRLVLLLVVASDERAPWLRFDGPFGPPDDIELPVGLYFADEHGFVEV